MFDPKWKRVDGSTNTSGVRSQSHCPVRPRRVPEQPQGARRRCGLGTSAKVGGIAGVLSFQSKVHMPFDSLPIRPATHSFTRLPGRLMGTVAALLTAVSAMAQAPADLTLLHGRIHTEDASRSVAQALAVRGNTIIAVGTDQAISRTGRAPGLASSICVARTYCRASSTLIPIPPRARRIWPNATWATRCWIRRDGQSESGRSA